MLVELVLHRVQAHHAGEEEPHTVAVGRTVAAVELHTGQVGGHHTVLEGAVHMLAEEVVDHNLAEEAVGHIAEEVVADRNLAEEGEHHIVVVGEELRIAGQEVARRQAVGAHRTAEEEEHHKVAVRRRDGANLVDYERSQVGERGINLRP